MSRIVRYQYRSKEPTTLRQALSGQPAMVGLMTSANACEWGRWIGTDVESSIATLVDACFEARFFNAQLELRWLAQPEMSETAGPWQGHAFLTSTQVWDDARFLGGPRELLSVLRQRALLWGEVDGQGESWATLTRLPRGSMQVPIGREVDSTHLALRYEEWVATDRFGNASVVADRWLDIVAAEERP